MCRSFDDHPDQFGHLAFVDFFASLVAIYADDDDEVERREPWRTFPLFFALFALGFCFNFA